MVVIALMISGNCITFANEYTYAGEKEIDALAILQADTVFMTNCDSYFLNGEKQTYPLGHTAFENEDGVSMVSCDLLSKGFDINIICSGEKIIANNKEVKVGSKICGSALLDAAPLIKNGVYFVPVLSYVENILGKYAYSDGRGFVIVSSVQRYYSNSCLDAKTQENSDIVCRYMQFDRPDGDKLYDFIKKHSGNVHPRMFIRAEEIESFREAILKSSDLKKELHALMEKCEKHINSPVVSFEFTDYEGPRLITRFREVRDVLFDLCVAYLITGNEKYGDRIWNECENVLSWEHWNIKEDGSGFLDASEVGAALAFSYDVLYDRLSAEQKNIFRNEIEEKYIDYCISVMEGKIHFKITDGRMTHSNWGAVCGASMFLTSMAFIDDLPEDDAFTKKCKFVASGALQALEFPAGTLFPDGAIHEGLEYWMFYVKNLALSVKALCNMCGEDFGFLSSPGFKETISYALNIQSVCGGVNYLSTSGEGKQLFPELYIIADLYGDDYLMQLIKKYITVSGVTTGARGLLFYKPSQETVSFDNLPLDTYFESGQVTTLRGSYDDKNAAYVAILGGANGTDSHFDKGSFVFEIGGERWFSELGGERKDVYGGYYHAEGWNLYRKRTEGHNALLINPLDNTAVKEFIGQNLNNGYNVICDDSRYTGQTIGKASKLERFESKEKGAIAVLDLKDIYGNQVSTYKRGFYLGDNRKSLTVRDELTLSGENSKIYWGLHTQGTVAELGEDYAVIEKNGKRLKVLISTNIPDFSLSVTEAQPLDTSMIRGTGVEGVYKEFSRDDFRKLMLKGEADGKVYIEAKFYLEEENIPALQNKEISLWTIPYGKADVKMPIPYENFKIISGDKKTADGDGIISLSAQIPYKPDELAVFVNGKKVISKTDNFNTDENETFFIDTKEFGSSNLNIRMDYILGGNLVSVSKNILVYAPFAENNIVKKTFEELTPFDTARDVHYKIMDDIGLYFSVDGFGAQGDGRENMKLIFNKAGEGCAGFIYRKELGILPGNGMNIKWKMSASDFVKMYIHAKDSEEVKTSPSRIDILPIFAGTHIYEIYLDGENYKYTVKTEDGEYVEAMEGVMKSEAGGFSEFQLKFYSITDNCSVILHSISVSEFEYAKIFTGMEEVNEGVKISLLRNDDMKIIKVLYNDDSTEIKSVNVINGDEAVIEKNGAIFVWNKYIMQPCCKCIKINYRK